MKPNQLKGLLLACILMLIAAPYTVAASNVLHIADNITAVKGDTVTVPIVLYGATNIGCAGINLSYDAGVVNVTAAEQGDFTDFFGFDNRSATQGWVTINTYRMGVGLMGDVIVAYVTLEAVGETNEESALNLGIISMTYPDGVEAPRSTDNGTFVVANNPPVLSFIGDKTIDEGQLLSFKLVASDVDGDILVTTMSNSPSAAAKLIKMGDVNEDGSVDKRDITLLIKSVFNPTRYPRNRLVCDLDSNGYVNILDARVLRYYLRGTPTDGMDNTVFSWTPTYNDAGEYSNVRFEVSDGTDTDSEEITISVNNVD